MNEKDILGKEVEVVLPDLSLSRDTVAFLSKILLDGGANEHTFENGNSEKISAKLHSGKDGFFDKAKFSTVTI